MRRSHRFMALAGAAMLALAACTPSGSSSESPGASAGSSAASPGASYTPATVRLQLQWLDQSQFSGYYAAEEQGYYADLGLTV